MPYGKANHMFTNVDIDEYLSKPKVLLEAEVIAIPL